MTDLQTFCASQQEWLLQFIEELVRLESPTDDKARVDRLGQVLAGRLAEAGGRVSLLPSASTGDHLRAEFGSGERQVLLLGHVDTVWSAGHLTRMPCERRDGRLHGPGVLDMKAGIALATLATRAVCARQSAAGTRIVMLWTSDEETGSGTSRALVEHEARLSDAVLVLEPALRDGGLKTTRKGCGEFEIAVRGVAAHAGVDPGAGASAVRELVRQLLAVETFQDRAQGLSVNAGVIAGGTRSNVVAEEARALIDVRAPTQSAADRLEASIRGLTPHIPGTMLSVRGGFSRPPMERTEGVARLFALAAEVGTRLGQTVTEGGTGGGSDGNFCAALGIPTLDGLGALGDGAHAQHEHVLIEALVPRAALLAGVLDRLTSKDGDE